MKELLNRVQFFSVYIIDCLAILSFSFFFFVIAGGYVRHGSTVDLRVSVILL